VGPDHRLCLFIFICLSHKIWSDSISCLVFSIRVTISVAVMSQFGFETDIHNVLRLDMPITNAPMARWQRKASTSSSTNTKSLSPNKSVNRSVSLSKTPCKTPGKSHMCPAPDHLSVVAGGF